ncbi:hypothetical protein [Hyphococcus sp.]|jgi:hypothetical protein|uniref:hypothetical protein n=1 Tax=Hyphococcus sp. TaxID=2038636 RepID=UPI003D0BE68A
MQKTLLALVSLAAFISPASAGDFISACIDGAPESVSASDAAGYCACLADETEGADDIRAELEASWPVTDIESWVADLSAEAGNAAAACQP